MKLLKKLLLVFVLLSLIDYEEFGDMYEHSAFVQQCSLAPKVPSGFWGKVRKFFGGGCHCPGPKPPIRIDKKIPVGNIIHLLNTETIHSIDDLYASLRSYFRTYQSLNDKIKTINILRNDIYILGRLVKKNDLRVNFYENSEFQKGIQVVESTLRTIKCLEYSIDDMSKRYFSKDGVDYVSFIIPKKPQFVFEGEFADHNVTEDFIVTVRSNFANRAEQVIRRMFNNDYWDDTKFQQECQNYDVQEMYQIKYVLIEKEGNDELVYKKTA